MRFGLLTLLALTPVLSAATAPDLPVLAHKSGLTKTETIPLPALAPGNAYAFLYTLNALPPNTRITVDLTQNGAELLHKTLHEGDLDFYADFRTNANATGPVQLHITAPTSAKYELTLQHWTTTPPNIKTAPAHTPAAATPITLGGVTYASGDETPYIPLPETPRAATQQNYRGQDWYKLNFSSATPKLVFFQLELTERDNVPVDVSVYRLKNGKPEGYYEGEDPVSFPHEVQALQGNKFISRILREPGDYYIAVRANHPEYKLRTRAYDPPPYADPQQAVRTAVDFIMGAGDSWHANTPRRGGVLDRIEPVHQETSLCVACHATHFSQRAQLYATHNGYPIVQRQQLQFMSERFYNNPRPFYGFEAEGASWARMISAAANVLSRMSHLMTLFETDITGEHRDQFHSGAAQYLKIYYADRTKLPPDETNGNTPLVSAHEVGWYSWKVTHDSRLPAQIAAGDVTNLIDLCYQTLALADMDPKQYADKIKANADRILSLQRPSGQWSMRFSAKEPEVEFQTGHALWALHAAGIRRDNPQVAKGLQYLLSRQQPFGGWMDPRQSFENFRTPFRETQMAVLALSAYYPANDHHKGWDAPATDKLSNDPAELLNQLDNLWDPPTPAVLAQLRETAASNNVLIRQAAVEALGRIADPATLPTLTARLADSSKLVQRTAAWAVRQVYSRHPNTPAAPLLTALNAANNRTPFGATRVFSQHFAALARRPEFTPALIATMQSPAASPLVRMQAIRGLWQSWFWSADDAAKSRIEDTILAATAAPQHPWVDTNLKRAIYNLADENIRYLYNNWVPMLARAEDRERAVRGRLKVEDRLAVKFANILDHGTDHQRRTLLTALTEFPLRRADVYDLNADLSKPGPAVYNRIGNDIEQIAFFGPSAERFATSLLPYLDSKDPEMHRLAENAALLVRDVKFADVNRLAGPAGPKTQAVAAKIYKAPPPAPVVTSGNNMPPRKRPSARLDDTFFRGYVQPILEKRGKDGYACVQCHATHTLFDGTLATVKNVVDTDNPEQSLLLRKPTSSSETEGIANSATTAHGGGIRFDKNSAEYAVILDWIKGAKE